MFAKGRLAAFSATLTTPLSHSWRYYVARVARHYYLIFVPLSWPLLGVFMHRGLFFAVGASCTPV